MFTVSLWSFAKDSNSTKQPTGTGTQFSCNILTPSDIIAPTVEISANDLTGYNYAYIPAFHRYYFIEGITFDSGLWRLALQCDVLATYKTVIGAQTLYVIRAAGASNGNIRDEYYPITANVTKRHVEQSTSDDIPGWVKPPGESSYRDLGYEGGYIILNIAGTGTAGATTLILLTTDEFKLLICGLYQSIDGFQLSDVVKSVVQKFGGNPQELINGALWVPAWGYVGDDYQRVRIGGWEAIVKVDNPNYPQDPHPYIEHNINGLYLDQPGGSGRTVTFSLQKHPQAATRGAYLNTEPYTSYIVGVPGCGVVKLDSSKLINESSISIYRTVDCYTGQYSVDIIASSSGQILSHLCGQIGIPITIRGANNTSGVGGLIGSVGSMAIGAATGNAAMVIGAATAGISSIAGLAEGTPTSSGMGGGFSEILARPIWMDTIHYNVSDADNTHNGRPLMENRQISTLSGFIMVQKGDIPISGTSTEAEQIKQLLEGGFYYE